MVRFLLLVIVALALALAGVAVDDLDYLIILAGAVFIAALVLLGMTWGKRRTRRPLR